MTYGEFRVARGWANRVAFIGDPLGYMIGAGPAFRIGDGPELDAVEAAAARRAAHGAGRPLARSREHTMRAGRSGGSRRGGAARASRGGETDPDPSTGDADAAHGLPPETPHLPPRTEVPAVGLAPNAYAGTEIVSEDERPIERPLGGAYFAQHVFLTIEEAAILLRCSPKAIYTMVERGLLGGAVHRFGRRVLLNRTALLSSTAAGLGSSSRRARR